MPAPANNNFADAEVIEIPTDGDTFTSAPVDNILATSEPSEPNRYRSVWYSYTPTSSGDATVDLSDSYMTDTVTYPFSHYTDTFLAVHTGTSVAALTQIASDDDSGSSPGRSRLTFSATSGTTYRIQVMSYGQSSPGSDITYITKVTGPATSLPGQITGVTATATAVALPATHPPITVTVDGETATADADALAADEVRAYEWAATAIAEAFPAVPPNDHIADALIITGPGTIPALGATREAGEPDGIAGGGMTESVWLAYTPAGPGELTFTATGCRVEIWEGVAYDDLLYLAGGNDSATAGVAAGNDYRIRITPVSGSLPLAVAYSIAFTVRTADLTLTMADTEIETTPASLRVSVLNGTPDGAVEFHIDGFPVWTDVFDSAGVIADVEIPVDDASAGTHTLTVTDTVAADTIDGAFTVLADPDDEPDDGVDEPDPTLPPTVTRWIVQDPDLGDYTFPINPKEMSTPFPARTLTVESTTAPDGQPLTWEGAPKPHPWEFRGHIETQDFYDQLVFYAESNRRYWLIDHRRRAWQVTFEAFEPTLRTRTFPTEVWKGTTYVMRTLIYRGPVTS